MMRDMVSLPVPWPATCRPCGELAGLGPGDEVSLRPYGGGQGKTG